MAKQLLGKPTGLLKPTLQARPEPADTASPAWPAAELALPEAKPKRFDSAGLHAALAHYHATENWYRHGLVKSMLYTDGVQCFAENGGDHGAYWFLDIVATEYWPLLSRQPFLVVELSVGDQKSAVIKVDDGNGRVITTRQISYTDMQPGDWRFFLTDNVLLLPGEY
ncbi:MAG: DUF6876 family protein [Candidatus Paceibacterota bacterium]